MRKSNYIVSDTLIFQSKIEGSCHSVEFYSYHLLSKKAICSPQENYNRYFETQKLKFIASLKQKSRRCRYRSRLFNDRGYNGCICRYKK